MSLDLSIIIPALNRVSLLKYTLESVRRAIGDLNVEILLVDDGSEIPLEEQLAEYADLPIRFLRQANQGLVIAKNNGLREAKGEFILFLDSDDLVHEDKLVKQVAQMRQENSDVSYTDSAIVNLEGPYDDLVFKEDRIFPAVTEPEELYIKLQPLPHSPIFRSSYLFMHILNSPIVEEKSVYNPIGETWIYYNLSCHQARITKVEGYYTIASIHEEDRLTRKWERLGVAALCLMKQFVDKCPEGEHTIKAKQRIGECAFSAWRRLPRRFNSNFENSLLNIWRTLPKGDITTLGGEKFQLLSKVLGVVNAARFLKYFQRPLYSKIRTIDDNEYQKLLSLVEG